MVELIRKTFSEVQYTTANHQRSIQLLIEHYNKTNMKCFIKEFSTCLICTFQVETNVNNVDIYHRNTILFAIKFCLQVIHLNIRENGADAPLPQFFVEIITSVLECQNSILLQARFYMCYFIKILFNNTEDDDLFEEDFCDAIEEKLLIMLDDSSHVVRAEAIAALFKLQCPLKGNCKIIDAYIKRLCDAQALVRKMVVQYIAPCRRTLPLISMRVRDENRVVRIAAYTKCATINPKYFIISDRQSILFSGFQEEDAFVQKIFKNRLIPEWIKFYDLDFLNFLNALKLDSNKDDVDEIMKNLMEIVFTKYTTEDVLKVLPLDENKLIKLEKLHCETVHFWNLVISYLQSKNDENLDKILPDVSTLCKQIENFLKKSSIFENNENQSLLKALCETITFCDLSEEAGRRNVNSLLLNILLKCKLNQNVSNEIVIILEKTYTSLDHFTTDIFGIVTELDKMLIQRNPIVQPDDGYELAKLHLHKEELESQKEIAQEDRNIDVLEQLEKDIEAITVKLAQMDAEKQTNPLASSKNIKKDVLQQILKILISYFKLPSVNRMANQLNDFNEKHLEQLMDTTDTELHKSVLELVTLYSFVDKEHVSKYLKIIATPLITSVVASNYDTDLLMLSINGITDLLLLYGPDIFLNNSSSLRRMVDQNEMINNLSDNFESLTANLVIETLVNMLDDEDTDVSRCAGFALLRLLVNEVAVSPNLLARIILKWFNPAGEIEDSLHQHIGEAIVEYARTASNTDVIQQCIVPIFKAVGRAPKHSPLADVDISNLIRFLCLITNEASKKINIHFNLACQILRELLIDPCSDESFILCQLLLNLELPDHQRTDELVSHLEQLLSLMNKNRITPMLEKYQRKLSLTRVSLRSDPSAVTSTIEEKRKENMSTIEEESKENTIVTSTTDSEETLKPKTKRRKVTCSPVKRPSLHNSSAERNSRKRNRRKASNTNNTNRRVTRSSASSISSNSADVVDNSDTDYTNGKVRRSKRRKF